MGDKFTEFMDLGGEVMEHFDVKKAKKKLKEVVDEADEKNTLKRAAKKVSSERKYQEYLKNMQGEKEAYYRQNAKRLMKEQDLSNQHYNQKNAYLRDKSQYEQKQAAQNRIVNGMAENPERRREQIRNKMAKENEKRANRVKNIARTKRELNETALKKLKKLRKKALRPLKRMVDGWGD